MGSPKKRIQYRYDSVGNRVGMTDPDGGRFTYSYDSVNRITQVINPQGDRTSYAYDAGGRRTMKKLANGTRASFSYDAASNLTRLANLKSDGTTISSFNYDYDRVGNRTAVLEADGSRVTWSYDDTYQLTGEHRSGTTPYEDSYSYDAAGNRLLKIHDGARTTYSYDAANQLEWSEDASGRTTYTFDADGNQELVVEPTGDRTTTSWDYENRTTLVRLPSGIRNTMAYEPRGLRVKLEESTGTKKFVWDDQNYLAETDENDDTQVVYTNEPRMYGNLVSQRRGADSHWYHFDAIGSTRELTNASETATDTRLFDAWGRPVLSTGSTVFPFGFVGSNGYYVDTDSLAIYVRARNYAPPIARWLSHDPVQTMNLYTYVSNHPTLVIDPTGAWHEFHECDAGKTQVFLHWTPRIEPDFTYQKLYMDTTIQFRPWVACDECCEIDLIQIARRRFYRNWTHWYSGDRFKEGDLWPEQEPRRSHIRDCSYNDWFVDINVEHYDTWFPDHSPYYNDSVIPEYAGQSSHCFRSYMFLDPWSPDATLHDTPSVPVPPSNPPPIVAPLEFEFETCAVCKDDWKSGNRCPPLDTLGCVKWKFRFGLVEGTPGAKNASVECSEGASDAFTHALREFYKCYHGSENCPPATIPYPPDAEPPGWPGF